MNASGPHSAERGEILELSERHRGALVFKSCNIAGLEAPENLKNRGVEHFAAIARELDAAPQVDRRQRGRQYRRRDRKGRGRPRSRGGENRRAQPGRRLRAELGRAICLGGKAQGDHRAGAREIGAALAVKVPPKPGDRGQGGCRVVQGDGRRDRGMRQRPAQRTGGRYRERADQGRGAAAFASAYVLAVERAARTTWWRWVE